jgi:hypothetical protein
MEIKKVKQKSKIFEGLKPIIAGYNSLSPIDKRLIWGFVGLVFTIILINLSMDTYYTYHNGQILNREDCVKVGVDVYHQLNDLPRFERFIFEYKSALGLLLTAVAIAWIFHGVGFRII